MKKQPISIAELATPFPAPELAIESTTILTFDARFNLSRRVDFLFFVSPRQPPLIPPYI